MMPRAILTLTLSLGVLLSSGLALASETFPRVVSILYKTPREPECTLCHETLEGGDNESRLRSGKTSKRAALAKNSDTLKTALVEAAHALQDSDEDGATNLRELQSGTDPNLEGDAILGAGGGGAGEELDFGGLDELPPLPAHGCAMRGTSK